MLRIPSFRAGMPIFKALSSETRLSIMELLQNEGALSISAIAEKLGLTAGTLTPHIRALQECGLISISMVEGKHGTMKICTAAVDSLLISAPELSIAKNMYETEIGIGQYTNYEVRPTCGICTTDHIIGQVDVPAFFSDVERTDAHIIWFSSGYVEYMLPCFLKEGQYPLELQLSMEISSEAPGVQENWPSDIHFKMNGVDLGFWTCPGDFGRIQGIYNPPWWFRNWNQHGLYKLLSINDQGTFMDGARISNATIGDIRIRQGRAISFRIEVPENAGHVGGATLFGKGFGNYPQDIRMRMHYAVKGDPS
ncbi:MAG: helix-turn-helix domain-containing protein [Clostridiales bacterium]|nr:helix-turn-helix domain-containing protein [Clostridia bacterium]MCR4883032.1 helix-turn-helix domain-containing protein [Clostridiales bacterium]